MRYRAKAVEFEAFQWNGLAPELPAWAQQFVETGNLKVEENLPAELADLYASYARLKMIRGRI